MIRYAVSVIYYEPYIYGKSSPVVWFRNIGQVRKLQTFINILQLLLKKFYKKGKLDFKYIIKKCKFILGIFMQTCPCVINVRLCGPGILDVYRRDISSF